MKLYLVGVVGRLGAASKTGWPLFDLQRLYRVGDDRSLNIIDELELEKDEDTPMSMDVYVETKQFACGINSSTEKLSVGENENCRVYGVKEDHLALLGIQGTLRTGDAEDYQKVTAFSPDGSFLVAAGAHDLSLLHFPSLVPAAEAIHIEKSDIYDATFSSSLLVVATTVNLLVYSLPEPTPTSPPKRKGKRKTSSVSALELVRTIELPTLPGKVTGSTFRAARFHPQDPQILYTVCNTIPPRTVKTRNPARPAFLCKWDTQQWEVVKVQKLSERGVTCFDASANGKLLAFGSSDYTIGVLDANTLAPLLTILKAHEFPPTTLRFNPTSTLLLSGSADNSVRIVNIPSDLRSAPWSTVIILFIALLVVLLAVLAQIVVRGGSKW